MAVAAAADHSTARARLDARLAVLGAGPGGGRLGAVPVATLGDADLDAALPGGGLRFAGLHEVVGVGALGFVAALLARLAEARPGALLWCQQRRRRHAEGTLYGPGFRSFGLDPARLLVVDAKDEGEVLWVLEEALRTRGLVAAVGEVGAVDLFRSRRLQLAAEAGGGAGLLLGPRTPSLQPSAALTRWRVRLRAPPAGTTELGSLAWTAEAWRLKGAVPARFEVAFDEPTLRFHLVADVADRSLSPRRQKAG